MNLGGVGSPALWAGFVVAVLVMLALDLGVFNRKAHVVTFREAALWSVVWVTLSLAFNLGLYVAFGPVPALEFFTGYLIEKTLSVDNIFVFVVVFSAFKVPPQYQHRVLFWGILSALILRAVMIFAGAAALARFHWLIYVFGAFLVLTGVKLALSKGDAEGQSLAMRVIRRVVPATPRLDGGRFLTVENGRRVATPLLLALLCIEITDVVFAVDSIPAIFAVTRDPFIVFTSNIFAILGLRSLFFLLAGMVDKFRYLRFGLAGVLAFVGAKMMAVDLFKVPPAISLGIIAAMLGGSVLASLAAARREEAGAPAASAGG